MKPKLYEFLERNFLGRILAPLFVAALFAAYLALKLTVGMARVLSEIAVDTACEFWPAFVRSIVNFRERK